MPTPTRSAALLRSFRFLDHDTGDHIENANRLPTIDAEIERQDLIDGCPEITFGPADLVAARTTLTGAHLAAYVGA
jgi:hypothetical protein